MKYPPTKETSLFRKFLEKYELDIYPLMPINVKVS